MSKTMQLTVRIRPCYKKDMKSDYPKISQGLGYVDEAWVDEGPSFFDIVGRLDKLLYEWDLAKANKTLYQIEDVFDQIEWELE
jgi:hypothetical protein